MKILALDQASMITGWSVFDDEKLVAYGRLEMPKGSSVGERLVIIRNGVKALIDEYQITYVGFEDIQMQTSVGNNVQTFKVLANVFGVILELCEELHMPYSVVSSVTWKSTFAIKGRQRAEQKRNAQLYVENTYHVQATQDECDAICIGAHIAKKNAGFNWT